MKKIIYLALLILTISVKAQKTDLKPITEYQKTYQVIYDNIVDDPNEELSSGLRKLIQLKEHFKKTRREEYLNISIQRKKRFNYTGVTSRRTSSFTDTKIIYPNNLLYIEKETVENKGKCKYNINDYNNVITLNVHITGKVNIKGYVHIIFKYDPDLIGSVIDNEADEMFDNLSR